MRPSKLSLDFRTLDESNGVSNYKTLTSTKLDIEPCPQVPFPLIILSITSLASNQNHFNLKDNELTSDS